MGTFYYDGWDVRRFIAKWECRGLPVHIFKQPAFAAWPLRQENLTTTPHLVELLHSVDFKVSIKLCLLRAAGRQGVLIHLALGGLSHGFPAKMHPIGAPPGWQPAASQGQRKAGCNWVNASAGSSLWPLKPQLLYTSGREGTGNLGCFVLLSVTGKQFFRSSVKSLLGNEKRARTPGRLKRYLL